MDKIVIAVIAVLGLVFGVSANLKAPAQAPTTLGALAGPDVLSYLSVGGLLTAREGFVSGGGVATLTDANGGTYTLTQTELEGSNTLKFAAGGAGQAVIALTLPATSTMTTLIPFAGDCREWIYDATALAAATTTTITAGTGHDVVAYTVNDDVIDGNEFAEIRMCRQEDGDVTTFTTEILQAD